MNSRRQFLIQAPLGLLAAAAACRGEQHTGEPQAAPGASPPGASPPPGAPPTFGTAPEAGPVVSPATFAEAEKLVQVTLTDAERDMAAANWRQSMAPLLE